MKKIIIWSVIALLVIFGVVLFVVNNYQVLDRGMVYNGASNTLGEYEEGSYEYAVMQNDININNEIIAGTFNNLKDGESFVIQGCMIVDCDYTYIFFGENSRADMQEVTGIKSKYFRNLNDGESLYIGIKDGEVNLALSSDDILFVNEYDPERKSLEIPKDGGLLFDVRKENGKTIIVY